MSHVTALYDNFEIFRKKIQRGRILKNRRAVCEISTDFQSENGFELTKDGGIKFLAIRAGSCKSVTIPLPNSRRFASYFSQLSSYCTLYSLNTSQLSYYFRQKGLILFYLEYYDNSRICGPRFEAIRSSY